MRSFANDFTLLVSAPSIVEAEMRANQLCSFLVRWADWKQLQLLPRNQAWCCSPQTPPTSPGSTLKCELATWWPCWSEPLKSWLSCWTPTSLQPSCSLLCQASLKGSQRHESPAGLSWGFTTKTLVATYRAILRPILNYATPIWFTQVSSTHLGKLEVIQNKALRIATGFHQMTVASHLRAETAVLPLRAHLELCSQQFYANALQPMHPSHLIFTFLPDPCPIRATLMASYHRVVRGLCDNPNAPPLFFGGVLEESTYPFARGLSRGRMIEEIIRFQTPNKVLMGTSPLQKTQPNNCCSSHTEEPFASSDTATVQGSSLITTP